MSEELLKKEIANQSLDDDLAIRRLAAPFGVSSQALTIRLTKLNLIIV
jgi:Zn-dependent peptidase ImmA (M78 family)